MGRLDVHIRHGGGPDGSGLIALAVIAAVLAGVIHAVWGVISAVLHVILVTLEVIAWTLAGTALAAAVGGTVWAGLCIRRAVQARHVPQASAPPVITMIPETPARPAIEPPRPSGTWPLPGWWEEIRPHIGHDDGGSRPGGTP
jgi:hypothetical protein